MEPRTFEARPAIRERTPLLLAIAGPSASGKTYSALRLACGIQRVAGGQIYIIDTEARRALHYAQRFQSKLLDGRPGLMHVPFGAPFGSLDYLTVIEYCVKQGAKTIVVDSFSHEHDGPGGLLECHAAELARMGGQLSKSMLAWQKPKAARRRLINTMLQFECNFVLCFRAKEKLKIVPGKEPEQRGFQPIAGEEFVYECTAKFLLLPGADGVPTFEPEFHDEKAMVKRPEQFRAMLTKPEQLSEDLGEKMARWAAGDAAPVIESAPDLITSYDAAADAATVRAINARALASWKALAKPDKEAVKVARAAAEGRVEAATKRPSEPPQAQADDKPAPTQDDTAPTDEEDAGFERYQAEKAGASS